MTEIENGGVLNYYMVAPEEEAIDEVMDYPCSETNYTHVVGIGYHKTCEDKKNWYEAQKACRHDGKMLTLRSLIQKERMK